VIDPCEPLDAVSPATASTDVAPAASVDEPEEPVDRSLPPWFLRALAAAAGWVVLLVAGAWVLRELRVLVVMVLIALFLSLAMEPLVDRLARAGWRRGTATFLVLLGVLSLFAALLIAAGTVLVSEGRDLIDHAPRYVRQLERFVNRDLGIDWNADSLVRDLRRGNRDIVNGRDITRNAVDVGLGIGGALLEAVTVLVFAFYMTADGPRMRRTICSRLPRRHQEMVLDTWELAIAKTGGYLYSRGLQAIISAAATTMFLSVLGIPYALALGVWVGVVSQFIPTIGTYIAMALPVIVALKEQPADALWVLLFLVAYQQFENYVLGPRVTRHTMDVHPALAIGTVFAGGLLLGGVGAVLALPATAVIQAVVSSYTTEREVVERPLTREPRRQRRFARLRAWRRAD
jgi:predicted PurR-regulated permease PerM